MEMGKGYYAYVWGGLAVVVAVTLVLSLTSENQTGEGVLPWILGMVAVWITGLLALQWRALRRHKSKWSGAAYGISRESQILATVISAVCLGLGVLGAYGKLPNFGAWEYWPFVPLLLAPLAFLWVKRQLRKVSEMGEEAEKRPPDAE